jgi:cytochrome c-type biogenesis protein CcmH/NrfG
MTVLVSPTAFRALLLAFVLACAAALMAPAARGAEAGTRQETRDTRGAFVASRVSCLVSASPAAGLIVADEFSWNEFTKFWSRQAGSVGGIVGTVLLVAGGAFLIIMSKGRG